MKYGVKIELKVDQQIIEFKSVGVISDAERKTKSAEDSSIEAMQRLRGGKYKLIRHKRAQNIDRKQFYDA